MKTARNSFIKPLALTVLVSAFVAQSAQAGYVVGGTKKGVKEGVGGTKKGYGYAEGGTKKGIKESVGGTKKGLKETKKFFKKVF